jgi:hypothetical protein
MSVSQPKDVLEGLEEDDEFEEFEEGRRNDSLSRCF